MGRIDKGARTMARNRRQNQRDASGMGVEWGDGFDFNPDTGRVDLALALDPALDFTDGELTVLLRDEGGLSKGADGLGVLLTSNPGLILSALGLSVRLRADPGLELVPGGLGVLVDGDSLTVGVGGVRVAAPEGAWAVTDVQTGAYAAAAGELVRCDPTGGAFTVTLPSAAGISGRQVLIKNTTADTTAISVAADGAETIDGAASVDITTAYGSLRLVSDGSGWMQT